MKSNKLLQIRLIQTEAEYNATLKEMAVYFEREPTPGSTDAERFDALAALIAAYEDKHWPIEPVA